MPILKIARMGHAVLSGPAEPVEDPTAPQVAALVRSMVETLEDAGGVGLAAPQVHVPRRIIIFHVPEARAAAEARGREPDPETGPVPLTVLINPEIVPIGEEKEPAFESCLSIPGMTGLVPRWRRIRYSGVDLQGNPVERTASGFHARVVQHECDHLDGILYPMRMTDLSTFGFGEEIQHRLAAGRARAREILARRAEAAAKNVATGGEDPAADAEKAMNDTGGGPFGA